MKCEACKGKKMVTGLGLKKSACVKCHGTGIVLELRRQTTNDEEVKPTQVVVKRKRGRPRKNEQ